eukprot:CAMPEP_0117669112 /NCGR_PEP_ID=MMETSP0804-20121206/11935_1 /TAXON_ID=1074897 /ORGANISM="Tetraselmis astigmatica, Strain CCMP880" /LENGTH=491 /DNA_ID=CAMNT_0005477101 /DNA_START=481 /DNA_END=1956 /DNA_ORIENTATION=+
MVWTQDACKDGGFMMAMGRNGKNAECHPKQDKTFQAAVMCCADSCEKEPSVPVPTLIPTGGICSKNSECISGTCRDGACFQSDECQAVKHAHGSAFDVDKINIVFVGSGFTDLSSWYEQVQKTFDKVSSYPPFSPQNERLNVFYVNEMADSFCNYNCQGIDHALCCDVAQATHLANKCFPTGPILQTIVIHNSPTYGGVGYRSANVATISTHEIAPVLAVHELGHSLFQLGDEYASSIATPENSANCDSSGCEKWADLIEHGGFGVTCSIKACKGDSYFCGETSIMEFLSKPVGHVNLRYSCCTYLALTKGMPSYCDVYDFSPGYLLNYCQANDYQGYGHDAYGPFIKQATRVGTSDRSGKLVHLDNPKMVQVSGDFQQQAQLDASISDRPPGLYPRSQQTADFKNLNKAWRSGADQVLSVTVFFVEGGHEEFIMGTNTEIDVAPLLWEGAGKQTNEQIVQSKISLVTFILDDAREVDRVVAEVVSLTHDS